MNIQELMNRLQEQMTRLGELRDLETRTDAQNEEFRTLLIDARSTQDEIRQLSSADSLIGAFQELRNTSAGRASENDSVAAGREAQVEEARSLGQSITESDEYRSWAASRSGTALEVHLSEDEHRTLVRTPILPTDYLQPQRLGMLPRESDLYGTLRDVLLVGTTSAESFLYFQEDTFTNNAAFVSEATATTGSSGLKPESGITFKQDTATLGTIAHWIPITNQFEWVAPELRSYIDGRLLDGLQLVEDTQLLSGDGIAPNPTGLLETTGIQVLDDTYFGTNPTLNAGTPAEPFDRLARAKRLIVDVARSRPNFIVMNPEDDEYFQTVTDSNGHYYGSGPFTNGQPTTFWGLRRIINENMPQGQALVGDGRQAQIWDRMSARIVVGLINDQFVRNMKTVLAEKRVGIAVYRPAAFAQVDLFA